MEWDGSRDRIVLDGGGGQTSYGDTWEWDGDNWTNVSPPVGPPSNQVSGGVAAWGLVIPTSPGLLGLHLYTQGWVADPSSSFGVGMSNAGDSVLGM